MRKALLFAAVMAVLFAPVAFAQGSESYYGGSFSRMSFVKGDVFVQHGQDAAFEQGELNLVVQEGDKIGTKDGRLEIQLGRRNYLRLGDYTQADIASLPRSGSDRTRIHLLSGRAFLRVGAMAGQKDFEVHTPDASFYILENGLYRIEVRENRQTEFAVFSGSAEAAGEEGSVVVNAREQVTAENGRFASSPGAVTEERDDFGEWNASRDATFARTPARTYLPADYSDYDVELADNGRWVNEAEYGDVWVPNVYSSDWRPYYYGHWSWYPIIGWTWVSDEPWGWCTYHYGRWGWRFGLGWYWIPERYWGWGPAWVSWYWDAGYVGWCPLSHWGYPGVILNNRFYGRYNERYYPHGSWAMTVVRRDQLQNRHLSNVALDRAGMNRLGNISMNRLQPNDRPSLNANSGVASRARQALSRDNLRSVTQSFATGRRLSPETLRSPARSQTGSSGADRAIRSYSSAGTARSLSRNDGASGGSVERRAVERGTSLPRTNGGSSASALRSFPSRTGSSGGAAGTGSSSRGRETVNRDSVRSFPSRRSGGESGLSSSPSRTYSAPSRSSGSSSPYNAPSRSYSAPSRSYSSPSYSAPSRSSSAPSYSAPSRSYSPPARSSGSPTYGAPSHSYSAPSRSSSYSAPTRSYSAPSRSYSAPSGSHSSSGGSVSRGSGSSSRSRIR